MAERTPTANTELHANSFEGGLNKDASKNIVDTNEYFDAQNLTLVESNKFYSLQNIKGTVELDSIGVGDDVQVLGVFETKYRVENIDDIKALTIFTVTPGSPTPTFKIIAYLLEGANEGPFVLYEALVPSDYLAEDRLIDGVLYPENGLDILYFTDNYYGIRKLRCDIPDIGSPDFISDFELSVSRGGALGPVSLGSVVNGGSLLCGSYQFAYQLLVPGTNKATKFSLLSLPIQIFDDSGTNPVSGIGLSTTKKILLNIFPSEEELSSYTHFRLAVIENVYPESTVNTIAQLSDTYLISSYQSGSYIKDIPYGTNLLGSSQTTPIDEVVIDLAAIDTVKTLAVRGNRLIAGNIKYEDLQLDNGTPVIGTGSVLKAPFDFYNTSNYEVLSRNVGHYRDEVYRYAISYFDGNGNFSPPTALDMSAVSENRQTSSIPDSNSSITITNGDFTTDFTDWGQVDPGTGGQSWAHYAWPSSMFGPGGGVARVTGLVGTDYSDILYHNITFTTGKSYVLQIRAAFSRNVLDPLILNDFEVVYLNNSNTILGTESITLAATSAIVLDPSSIPLTEVTLSPFPVGTTRIGFRGFQSTNTNSDNRLYIDRVTIIGGFKDMRFPARDNVIASQRYSVLNSDNLPENLGLQLNSITGHPTWARGFVILRSKRKKNIIWQSPLLPMTSIYGVGAMNNYPSIAFEQSPTVTVNYPDAQPMGPNTTYFPNNYFFAKSRNIVKNTVNVDTYNPFVPQSAKNTRKAGEAMYEFTSTMTYGLVFPPQTIYTDNSKYVFNESHDLVSVDAALIDVSGLTYSTPSDISTKGGLGNFLNTSVSGTFKTDVTSKFYYDASHSGVKTPVLKTSRIFDVKGYRDFDNLTEGFSLNGADIMKKQNLVTAGVAWDGIDGFNIQRGAVVHIAKKSNGSTESIINTDTDGTDSITFSNGSAMSYVNSTNFLTYISGGTTQNVNTIEIVNCVANLGEDRYGNPNTFNEYIYTGAHVVFSNSELSTVQAGGSLPKSVTVWGGDCIVTKHRFKVSDTHYGVENGNKHLVAGGGLTEDTLIPQWTRAYSIREVSGDNNDGCMSFPVQFKNCEQIFEVWLESEYNGALVARGQINESACRTPLSYDNNINHTKQNDQKIFVPVDSLTPNIVKTKARIIYSDEKVYQGGIQGFDIFRALNFTDLDETYGGITKLVLVGDDLYSLQEKAITYLPVGQRILEQTDSSTLAVRSGDVIGNPILLDVRRGCQHIKSVQNTGRTVYFADNFNKAIYALGGRELKIISDDGMQSEFRSLLANKIAENELTSVYDPIRREYWIADRSGDFCYIFNERGKWSSNLEFPNGVKDGYYTNQKLYIVCYNATDNNVHLYEMYENSESFLVDEYVIPRVQFTVNPQFQFGKNFDDFLVVSSDRLSTVDLEVERESDLGNQVSNGLSIDVPSRGLGNYRVKILRDADSARLKGSFMKATIKWKSGEDTFPVTLTTVLTQYRPIRKLF